MNSRHFVTFDASGKITGDYVLPIDAVPPDGAVEVGPEVSWLTHWMDGPTPVPYTESQRVSLASQPSPFHVWNARAGVWEDPRPLDEIKAERRARITERRMAEDQRFPWRGKWYQADTDSWKQITGVHGWVTANGSLPPWFPGFWKAEDNTYTTIPDVQTWWDFYGSALSRGSENFVHAENLKARVASAASKEEVEAVPEW